MYPHTASLCSPDNVNKTHIDRDDTVSRALVLRNDGMQSDESDLYPSVAWRKYNIKSRVATITLVYLSDGYWSPAGTHQTPHSPAQLPSFTVHRPADMDQRIFELEKENVRLRRSRRLIHRPIRTYTREGRAIRRLVSLSDSVIDLTHEFDRRVLLAEGLNDIENVDSTDKQERAFRSYMKLVNWCPSIMELMRTQDADELGHACGELKKGADGARGDDTNNLKRSVAIWLNSQTTYPTPFLAVDDKQKRGFSHDLTGSLICPVDYDWTDPVIRNAIRKYSQNYPVTAYMWPTFLYAKGQYQRNRPSVDLFKGELLLRAFRCIFTSPSSARRENTEEDSTNDGLHSRRGSQHIRPRCNVATLLKMRTVEPRAIAYVAVQLRFALSSCASWNIQDDDFNYDVFYNNMLDWFERPRTQTKAELIEDLLLWWNEMIFGHRQASAAAAHTQGIANLSVAVSME